MARDSGRAEMGSLVRGVFRERAKEPFLTLNLLRQHWTGVVGPELGARTHPLRLDGSTLWIGAPDACWAYELQFFKAELLSSVQAFLESRSVSDVRFQPGGVPEPAAAAAPAAAPEPTPETPAALARAATAIGDSGLRAVFQRALAKQRRARARQEPPAADEP
jgi:hypothetical protein